MLVDLCTGRLHQRFRKTGLPARRIECFAPQRVRKRAVAVHAAQIKEDIDRQQIRRPFPLTAQR